MLTIGVILLILGAVVALASRGRDDAVRLIGLGVAVLGLVLIVVAVLPADAHSHAAVLGVPFWRFRWRRRRARVQIDPEFARVLAAQIAVGMARNPEPSDPDKPFGIDYWGHEMERSSARARSSLATIGLMLLQACKDDSVVQETLRTDLEVDERPGVTTLRRVG